ncbi:hypothetical protein AB1L88_00355 [Tautonia sp. JC769]|uniref:hypothetical protein n=1 Tax=Tautonia sp. JC769 TaxID=3232135 RepID=UPI003458C811
MDPVDILTMSVRVAQLIRSSSDPELTIIQAYGALGLDPPGDRDEPMAVRVARLVERAGSDRGDLDAFLRDRSGPLPWNRTIEPEPSELLEADPEAVRLVEFVEDPAAEASAFDLFTGPFPPFSIAERAAVSHFDREEMLQQLADQAAEAGEPVDPNLRQLAERPLPVAVRGLIDYPIEIPALFAIETGEEPWNTWEICCAFAEQYRKIYESAGAYGVWGHDLTDLWIERLLYYPTERLIYPLIGS